MALIRKSAIEHSQRGQNVVEFALVIPMFLTVVVGIFEMGRAAWIFASVYTASREATRYAISSGDEGTGTPHYIDCTTITSIAQSFGAPADVDADDITISYDNGPATSSLGECPLSPEDLVSGDRIVVQVTGHFTPATFLPIFDLPTLDFDSTTRRTIVKELALE